MVETLILGIQELVGDIMVATSIFTVYGWSFSWHQWLAGGLDTKTT